MRLALQSDTVLAMQLESNGTTPDGDLANQTLSENDIHTHV